MAGQRVERWARTPTVAFLLWLVFGPVACKAWVACRGHFANGAAELHEIAEGEKDIPGHHASLVKGPRNRVENSHRMRCEWLCKGAWRVEGAVRPSASFKAILSMILIATGRCECVTVADPNHSRHFHHEVTCYIEAHPRSPNSDTDPTLRSRLGSESRSPAHVQPVGEQTAIATDVGPGSVV